MRSVNAVGSAAEVEPLFEHYSQSRCVYAIDLPGFGGSDRSEKIFDPRLMTDALHAVIFSYKRQACDVWFRCFGFVAIC